MKYIKQLFLITSLVICVAIISDTHVSAASAIVEKDGVMQMGGSSGYIVYYPVELETSDRTYPIATWANGTMCPPALYYDLLIGVAKSGYIVVASSEMMSRDGTKQISAIDYVLKESTTADSPLCGKVDPNRIGAFGHSQGGRSSVNAAVKDSRIGAVVSIAGASSASEAQPLLTPTLFLTGTSDIIVKASDWVIPSYEACQGPAVYASLKGGIHTSCSLKADAYIDYIVKWFNAWLYESDDMSSFTNGGEMSQDSAWVDYKTKNMNSGLTGSVIFSDSSSWKVVALLEFAVIVCILSYNAAKKKTGKKEEKL